MTDDDILMRASRRFERAAEFAAQMQMPAWGVPGETPEEGEWPPRDRVPFVREAEVTPEMANAGLAALGDSPRVTDFADAACIYRAMHAESRVPLVSDGELAADKLIARFDQERRRAEDQRDAEKFERLKAEQERDAAQRNFEQAIKINASLRADWTDAAAHSTAAVNRLCETADMRDAENTTLRAELMAAHDKLAKLTVVPDPLIPEMADRICEALAPWVTAPLHRMAYEDAARAVVPDSPKPAHDFTRDFSGDRRRMGLA